MAPPLVNRVHRAVFGLLVLGALWLGWTLGAAVLTPKVVELTPGRFDSAVAADRPILVLLSSTPGSGHGARVQSMFLVDWRVRRQILKHRAAHRRTLRAAARGVRTA